jgi:subtilisin-like proprotein convertase family protein
MMKYLPLLVLFFVGNVGLAQSPFCVPNFTGGNNPNLCINKVEISTFSTGTGSEGNAADNYQDNTFNSAGDLCAGSTYKLKLNIQRSIYYVDNPGSAAFIQAWADWNNDGVLDAQSEAYNIGEVATATVPGGGLFTLNGNDPLASVPADVEYNLEVPSNVTGDVNIRIGVLQELSQASCNEFNIGEIEDFKVTITDYGSLNTSFMEVVNLDSVDVSLTTTVVADPITWEFFQNGQFVIQNGLANLSNIKYKPGTDLNILRAYADKAVCLTDTSGQSRAYSNSLSIVKLGATEIKSDLTTACVGDSVNTYVKYRNEISEFENTDPTTIAAVESPVQSVITVDKGDVLDHTSLNKVCINLTTDYMDEVSFILQSPSGKRAILSVHNGNTTLAPEEFNFCFSDSAGIDFINGYTAALNDTFAPVQPLNIFNTEVQQGDWSLFVFSDYLYGTYVMNSWSLEFGHQSFSGWTDATNYEDATLDSAKTEINASGFYKASFDSYYGSSVDSVEIKTIPSEDVKLDQLTIDDANICPGVTSVFRSTQLTGHQGVYYEWYLNGVLQSGENEDTIQIANLNDGDVVKVVADVQNNCSTSKDSLTINVAGQTFKDAQLSLRQDKEFPLCESEDLLVNVDITDGDANFSSEWLVNNVSMSQNTSSYNWMSVNDNDSLIYNYTQTNACGKVQTFSDTIVYEGTVRENISATMNVNNGVTFCENQTISFFVTVNDPNISANYTWFLDGTDILNNANAYESSALAIGDHTIDVVYEPNGGCFNQENTVATVDFSIDPIRNTLLEIGGQLEFCEDDNLVFNIKDSAFIGSGALYKWFENGVEIPGETTPTLSIASPLDGNKYVLEATSDYNCATPAIVTSNEIALSEKELLDLDADFEDKVISEYCDKTQFVNGAIFTGDADLISSQWNLNGNFLQDGEDLDYELTEGTHLLEFVFDFDKGCDVVGSKTISTSFEVFSPADTVFQVIQNSTQYSVELTNPFEETSTTYEWALNGEYLSNDAEPVFELQEEGSYTICMSTTRGVSEICPSTKCLEFVYIGIDDVQFSNSIDLFPNPAESKLYLKGEFESEVAYKILDMQGKIVDEGSLDSGSSVIEVRSIESGAYQIVISDNSKVGVKSFIKM